MRQQVELGGKERISLTALHECFGRLSVLSAQRRAEKEEAKKRDAEKKKKKRGTSIGEGDEEEEEDEKKSHVTVGEGSEEGEHTSSTPRESDRDSATEAKDSSKSGDKADVQDVGEKERNDAEGGSKSEGPEVLENEEVEEVEEVEAPPPTELLTPPDLLEIQEYKKLTSLVDSYLRNNNEYKLMHESFRRLQEGLERARDLRLALDDVTSTREQSMKLGSKTGTYFSMGVLGRLLSKLGWA